ncbi:MAG: enamine deaminase RidA [Archangium gephyra]|uniref:Enamine deaminase RidA n=1 Tax=Archangium gephyra TaxID=48 RepID=A0A2W5VPK8_9BACT|nr:MAG: enamine deaminase RidA [Archangium gephyra]
MTIKTINPEKLFKPEFYDQVSVATGTKLVFIAGQVAHDGQGGLVAPGDLEQQVEQAFINVGHALEAAGATFANVAKTTIYVTKWSIDQMPQFGAGFARAAQKLGITTKPPTSLIGVEVLFHPDVRVEMEVTAVLG